MRRCPSLISTMPTIVSSPMATNITVPMTLLETEGPAKSDIDGTGQRRHDAAEDDDGDAVPDAELGDELTHPDQQHRARRHRQQRGESRQDRARISEAKPFDQRQSVRTGLLREQHPLTVALEQRQWNGQPVGVLIDLVAPALALVRQLIQARE